MAKLPTSCACEGGAFSPGTLETTFLGTDELYAEISVDRCTLCGRHWLRYALEFEGRSGSGRWYRGPIGSDVAFSHRNAASILQQLPEYWAGGSHFGGRVERRSGPIDVSP